MLSFLSKFHPDPSSWGWELGGLGMRRGMYPQGGNWHCRGPARAGLACCHRPTWVWREGRGKADVEELGETFRPRRMGGTAFGAAAEADCWNHHHCAAFLMNPRRLKASHVSSPPPEVCFSTFQKHSLCLLKGMPQANMAANQPPCLSTTPWHIPVTLTTNGGMDPFRFKSTKTRLSSHPAGWGRVVKVGDSDGGSMDWVH